MKYDRNAYLATARADLPALGASFADFVPEPRRPHIDMLRVATSSGVWTRFRLWALVRMSGCWPLPTYGGQELPRVLPCCQLCGATQILVDHALCDCPSFQDARVSLQLSTGIPSPITGRSLFLLELLRDRVEPDIRAAHIDYVSAVVGPFVRCSVIGSDMLEATSLPDKLHTSASSLDASQRLMVDRSRDSFSPPEATASLNINSHS